MVFLTFPLSDLICFPCQFYFPNISWNRFLLSISHLFLYLKPPRLLAFPIPFCSPHAVSLRAAKMIDLKSASGHLPFIPSCEIHQWFPITLHIKLNIRTPSHKVVRGQMAILTFSVPLTGQVPSQLRVFAVPLWWRTLLFLFFISLTFSSSQLKVPFLWVSLSLSRN